MGTSLKDTLNGMQGLWDKSQAAYDTMFGGAKVPENTYDAELSRCFIKTAQSGNPYIGREFTILEGEQEGAKVFDRIMLHNETGPVFARRFIDQCGYQQPKKSADLEPIIKAIEERGLKFQIQVKHNGDFVNVNILKNLEEGGEGEGEGETPAAGEGEGEDAGTAEVTTGDDDNGEAEEFRQSLLKLCRAQDIKVNDDDSTEDILAEMGRYEFEEANLVDEEVKLLEDAGLSDNIQRKPSAPPPKATTKPAAPKPTGKPAPASAPAKAAPAKAAPATKAAPPARRK